MDMGQPACRMEFETVWIIEGGPWMLEKTPASKELIQRIF